MVALAMTAAAAQGLPLFADHMGHVKGDPQGQVAFDVKHTTQGRKVTQFTVTGVSYTCSSGEPPGRTGGLRFEHPMRVRNRVFEGRGDWLNLQTDPKGPVSGKFNRNGVVVGTFKIHGGLAGGGSSCTTGLQSWRATKQASPPPP